MFSRVTSSKLIILSIDKVSFYVYYQFCVTQEVLYLRWIERHLKTYFGTPKIPLQKCKWGFFVRQTFLQTLLLKYI